MSMLKNPKEDMSSSSTFLWFYSQKLIFIWISEGWWFNLALMLSAH